MFQVSLLLICMKDEVARSWPSTSQHKGEVVISTGLVSEVASPREVATSSFLSDEVLQVIGSVLRRTDGLPLDLLAHIDPVRITLSSRRYSCVPHALETPSHIVYPHFLSLLDVAFIYFFFCSLEYLYMDDTKLHFHPCLFAYFWIVFQ